MDVVKVSQFHWPEPLLRGEALVLSYAINCIFPAIFPTTRTFMKLFDRNYTIPESREWFIQLGKKMISDRQTTGVCYVIFQKSYKYLSLN